MLPGAASKTCNEYYYFFSLLLSSPSFAVWGFGFFDNSFGDLGNEPVLNVNLYTAVLEFIERFFNLPQSNFRQLVG